MTLHLTIQEYLAARFLSERRDSFARIRPRLHDPRWTEVVKLTASTLRGDYAATFVEQILDAHAPHEEIEKRLPSLTRASSVTRQSSGQQTIGLADRPTGEPKLDLRRRELIRTLLAFLDVTLGADCLVEGVTVAPAVRRWTVRFVIDRWLDDTVTRHRWRRTLTRLGREVATDDVDMALRRVLADATSDAALKADAVETLAEINPRPETARVLLDVLTTAGESDWVRAGAARGLAGILRTDEDLRRMLLAILMDRTRESKTRRYAAVALGETGRLADNDIRVFLEILLDKHNNAEVRWGAAEALGELDRVRPDVEDALVRVVRNPAEDPRLRFTSAIAAGRMPGIRTSSLSVLLKLLQDPTEDAFVRWGALLALGWDEPRIEGLGPTLFSIVRNPGEDPFLRGEAAPLLAATALDHDEAGEALVALARDKAAAAKVRMGAIRGLGKIGARHPPGLRTLVEVMRDATEEAWLRTSALFACAERWRDHRSIIPLLLEGIDDPEIHDNVLSALFKILSEGGPQAIEQVTGPIDG